MRFPYLINPIFLFNNPVANQIVNANAFCMQVPNKKDPN